MPMRTWIRWSHRAIVATTLSASVAPYVATPIAPAIAPAIASSATRPSTATEDGYDLWLRYRPITPTATRTSYRTALARVAIPDTSATSRVIRDELTRATSGFFGAPSTFVALPATPAARRGLVVVALASTLDTPTRQSFAADLARIGTEGFVIRAEASSRTLYIVANTAIGTLHGVFQLLRLVQTGAPLTSVRLTSAPRIERRVLDHWDNLDGSIERGYAGKSLWQWSELPAVRSPRYRDYARANASLGLNGTVLTNVNANATVLSSMYLSKVRALADEMRPYGIRVYLTARFSAPIELGKLPTADPLNADVRAWWTAKINEIYDSVPDFGGFVVKANSEGQPGPQDYRRSHADGANMLGEALAPHHGVVMWRAFVYSNEVPTDRIKQAYDEFVPLDGKFLSNVMVQVKNGPLDFQPREPVHPLFGAMSKTPLVMEFQITKEYLGQDTHLVYLGPLFEEVLRADTYAHGAGSTVARVIDGSLDHHAMSGIAGVANIGDDRNWTGSHFNQANWYAFGRLSWDPQLSASDIATEWIQQTLTHDTRAVAAIRHIMMISREAVVNYMTPLGLAHIMATGHHYGPAPWVNNLRPDWTPVYYHRADTVGLGFDRTASGTNAIAQYAPPIRDRLANAATTPDSVLLFFHHVPWTARLKSGRTLWNDLVWHYDAGIDSVRAMREQWRKVRGAIDSARFADVDAFLTIQSAEAKWWRDAAISYFQPFSKQPLPPGAQAPAHPLDFYLRLRCPADPRKPRCPAID